MAKAPVVECKLCGRDMTVEDDAPELVLHTDCEARMKAQDAAALAQFHEAVTAGERDAALSVLARFRAAHR